ncbi:hypothetical protein GE061_008301 [Apolygus lucorum]|uniref:Uncharacterized protein n=1 Tax=Apolygus lucorum TaxID=248454 RepID=A0A6A4IYK9_APOLU|nr:hypothetical protein GE061_008301 [Apolygus lucorum]
MKRQIEEMAAKSGGFLKTSVDEVLVDWRRHFGLTTVLDVDATQERLGGIFQRISLMFKGKGLYDVNDKDCVSWTWSAMDLPMTPLEYDD